MNRMKTLLAAAIVAGAFAATSAHAVTFRFADQGDAISMDPYALNESLQLTLMGNIYEPLVGRGKKLELIPDAGDVLEADRAHGLALQLCARASSSTTGRRSPQTT